MNVYRTYTSHKGPIHDIQLIPNDFKLGVTNKPQAFANLKAQEGLTKFVTCSSDRTVRFWHYLDPDLPTIQYNESFKNLARNAYCKDLSSILFVQSDQQPGERP